MGKKGKKAQAGKSKKLTPKDANKRLNALGKKFEKELEGADLFAPLPPTDDCAICLVPLPRSLHGTFGYHACCGNHVCVPCRRKNDSFSLTCPFCREPVTDYVRQIEVRASKGDGHACFMMGAYFQDGDYKDEMKALHYLILAAEFGSADACGSIGVFFRLGKGGLPVDTEAGGLFYKVGALRGDLTCRQAIGTIEYGDFGNYELAIRHWKVAAAAGYQPSLDRLRDIYNANGKKPGKEFIGKDELDSIYRMGYEEQQEVKSEEREKYLKERDNRGC